MAERDIDVGRRSRNFCWREDIAPKGSGPNVLSERVSRIGVIYLAQHVRALDLRDSLGRVSPSGRDVLNPLGSRRIPAEFYLYQRRSCRPGPALEVNGPVRLLGY